jgi:desulfoferrodoxin-like iron-binding protein
MAEQGKTYRCEICGQEVKVTKEGHGSRGLTVSWVMTTGME